MEHNTPECVAATISAALDNFLYNGVVIQDGDARNTIYAARSVLNRSNNNNRAAMQHLYDAAAALYKTRLRPGFDQDRTMYSVIRTYLIAYQAEIA